MKNCYELYWTWNSAAMGCHAALEELGVQYELNYINFDAPWPDEYLKLNPHRKVPTLVDRCESSEPVVVYQSAAILLYLAERHKDGGLLPEVGSPLRAECYQQLFFMAEMLQSSFMMVYYSDRFVSDPGFASSVKDRGVEWISEFWSRLDQHIGGSNYMVGNSLTVCDFYYLPMALWNREKEFTDLKSFRNVSRVFHNMLQRPSVQEMLKQHFRE